MESSGIICHIIVFTRIEKKPVPVIGIECPELLEKAIIVAILKVGFVDQETSQSPRR
jgi:hypothetical protein